MGKSEPDVRLVKAHIEIFLIRDCPKIKDNWITVANLLWALKEKNICQNKEDLTQKIVIDALNQIDFVQLNENKTKIRRKGAETDLQINQNLQKVKFSKNKGVGRKTPGKPQASRSFLEKKTKGDVAKAKKAVCTNESSEN